MRQNRILLGLVEAMDFIDEQHRAHPMHAQPIAGSGNRLAQIGDTAGDSAHGHEMRMCGVGDHTSGGGFASAGRSPQNQGAEAVRLDRLAQKRAGANHMLLTNQLVQRLRSHARGQRSTAIEFVSLVGLKQIHEAGLFQCLGSGGFQRLEQLHQLFAGGDSEFVHLLDGVLDHAHLLQKFLRIGSGKFATVSIEINDIFRHSVIPQSTGQANANRAAIARE